MFALFASLCIPAAVRAQEGKEVPKVLRTPLKQETIQLLRNEISGQMIFNNEVKLAGAPWVRNRNEFSDTFYEAREIYNLVKSYGVETTELEKYKGEGKFDYPSEGELWITEPEQRLIARIGADAALIARGSRTCDITAELVYIAPLSKEEIKKMIAAGPQEKYRGKLALMWSHARGEAAQALDAAGIRGVISFASRDRYLDPDQVIYGSGTYDKYDNLALGMTVSWRQWSELLEDLETKEKVVLHASARIEQFPDRFESVYSWIPGTEPDAKGVIFTAHLFEGYTKRGANDNMSGCVVQLEILRALSKLIAHGDLPQPRRNIYFLWPNEISGTFEFLKQHPGYADQLSININMDMVGEGLRKNNSVFTMSECPGHLPSYLDGLGKSILNYVWRTNDIVYLPDSPRGRPGGQYFPTPMVEKNGSVDAFRFFIHAATGGSDHLCFNNSSVAVPGIEFFTWPDQWYHADTDTPDKGDPTEMKRVAFIGAASAWVAANCTDDVLPGLLDAVSDFGYERVGGREIPRAMAHLQSASGDNLASEMAKALNIVRFGVDRETQAVRSIEAVYSGSDSARTAVGSRIQQFETYRKGLESLVTEYARTRAKLLGIAAPGEPEPTGLEMRYTKIVPTIGPEVEGREFRVGSNEKYAAYLKENPEAIKKLGLTSRQAASILNYVNGRRTITEIRDDVAADLNEDIPLEGVAGYLELLKSIRWVVF